MVELDIAGDVDDLQSSVSSWFTGMFVPQLAHFLMNRLTGMVVRIPPHFEQCNNILGIDNLYDRHHL